MNAPWDRPRAGLGRTIVVATLWMIIGGTLTRPPKLVAQGGPCGIQGIICVSSTGDIFTNIRSAVSTLESGCNSTASNCGGTIYLPQGNYTTSSNITCPNISPSDTAGVCIWFPNITIIGAGRRATVINYTGTGDAIRMQDTIFNQAGGKQPAGTLERFQLIGTASATSGIHVGDMISPTFRDLSITGFSNSGCTSTKSAFWFDNEIGWTEHTTMDNIGLGDPTGGTVNCVGMLFSRTSPGTNSFARFTGLNLSFNVPANGIGVQTNNDISLFNMPAFQMVGNLSGSPSTVIKLTGTSSIHASTCAMGFENNAGGTQTFINAGGGTSFDCHGTFSHTGMVNTGSGTIYTDAYQTATDGSTTGSGTIFSPAIPTAISNDTIVTGTSQSIGPPDSISVTCGSTHAIIMWP